MSVPLLKFQEAKVIPLLSQWLYSIYDPSIPCELAAVTYRDRQAKLALNEERVQELTPSEFGTILTHEAMHLYRQHLHPRHKDKDLMLWNLACDAWINMGLHEKDVVSIGLIVGPQRFGLPQCPLPNELVIYSHLIDSGKGSFLDISTILDLLGINNGDETTVELTSLKIRKILTDAANNGDVLAKNILNNQPTTFSVSRPLVDKIKTWPLLQTILSTIPGTQVRGWKRGWRREGRGKFTAGRSPNRTAMVLIALDISGSISTEQLALQTRLARGLKLGNISCDFVAFAETASNPFSHCSNTISANINTGATNFGPVFKAAHKYDALIMFTDGQADKESLPRCPVVWAWSTQSYQQWELRSCDRQVMAL